MKSVLLAVDGFIPGREAFGYALELCRRTRAGLQVLQIVQARDFKDLAERMRTGVTNAGRLFESIMAAAAFAESGESREAQGLLNEIRERLEEMVPPEDREIIPIRASLAMGRPEKEIPRYVGAHHDIVLAIYNKGSTGSSQPAHSEERGSNPIPEALPVPLVVFPGAVGEPALPYSERRT